jgi:catechol 2,3-dioxygenase-like lactoylglutathione lyase family enzyme
MSEKPFELSGVNHLALVCRDMARTVDFYSGVLGMPLIKTIELPVGMGQHFFFDCGGGDCLAFFWFPNAGAAQPGVSNAPAIVVARPVSGSTISITWCM